MLVITYQPTLSWRHTKLSFESHSLSLSLLNIAVLPLRITPPHHLTLAHHVIVEQIQYVTTMEAFVYLLIDFVCASEPQTWA